MQLPNISIILPTFNEGENLKQLVPELLTVFRDLDLKDSEIIISDDGSTDNTKDVLEKIDFKDNNVTLLERSAKPSLPMSIYDGICLAKNEVIMWLDADGSMPAATVKKMIQAYSTGNKCGDHGTGMSKKQSAICGALASPASCAKCEELPAIHEKPRR